MAQDLIGGTNHIEVNISYFLRPKRKADVSGNIPNMAIWPEKWY